MTPSIFAINTNRSLSVVSVENTTDIKDTPVHRYLLVDVSYSMYHDLKKIGEHIQNALIKTVCVGDLITVGWFSGRGQHGIAIEALEVQNAEHLKTVGQRLKQALRPVGSTGFVEPLKQMAALAAARPSETSVLNFMTDGYDNNWSRAQILESIQSCGQHFDAISIVEYGWYANSALLVEMAQLVNAKYVFAEEYDKYSALLDEAILESIHAVPRVSINASDALHGIVYLPSLDIVSKIDDKGMVSVPENVGDVVWIIESHNGRKTLSTFPSAPNAKEDGYLYGMMDAFSRNGYVNDVWDILKALGDVRLIHQFTNCFGKQAFIAFQEACHDAMIHPSQRLIEGYDPNLVPKDDAFTVLDILHELISHEDNKLLIGSPHFSYERIGRATTKVDDKKDDKEQILEDLKKADTPEKLQQISQRLQALGEPNLDISFTRTQNAVPLSNLVFHSSRPNVSGTFRIEGNVVIGKNDLNLPWVIPSFIFRNYTFILDGIVHMKRIPLALSPETLDVLLQNGVTCERIQDGYLVTLEHIPVINRKMVTSISAKTLFETELLLQKTKGAVKVYKDYQNTLSPPDKGEKLRQVYGDTAAQWLAEHGITDSGYNPKVKQNPPTDSYWGRELNVSLTGLKTLPKVSDVLAAIKKNNPLKPAQKLMSDAIIDVENYTGVDKAEWVEKKRYDVETVKRNLSKTLSQIKFAIIVGKAWFPEFTTYGEGTLTMPFENDTVKCSVTLKDIEIPR